MSLTEKNGRLQNFEEPLNLHIIVGQLFSLPLRVPGGNRAKLNKLFKLNSILMWW